MLIKLFKPIKLVGDDERIIPVTLKDDLEGQFHYLLVSSMVIQPLSWLTLRPLVGRFYLAPFWIPSSKIRCFFFSWNIESEKGSSAAPITTIMPPKIRKFYPYKSNYQTRIEHHTLGKFLKSSFRVPLQEFRLNDKYLKLISDRFIKWLKSVRQNIFGHI